MRRRLLISLVGALLLGPLLAAPGLAGPDDALAFVDEADVAMKEHAYGAAEGLYRKAIEAMDDCVPALHGLGEALLAQEKTDDAILAFRQAARVASASDALPAAWQDFAKRSTKRLEALDEHGRALAAIVDGHVDALVRLAVKFRSNDPDLADRALDIALSLRPDHERAAELRGKMSDRGARREALFDGKQIEDWDGGRSDWWHVEAGVIVGETKGIASYVRTQEELSGDFDVLMEARIAEVYDKAPFIAVMGAWKAEHDHSRFGVLNEALTWFEKHGEDDSQQVYRCEVKRLPKAIDPSQWNTYELRFRKDRILGVINGREVHAIDRTAQRSGGYVGILSQGCRAEIRKVEVIRR